MCSFNILKWTVGHTFDCAINDIAWMIELIPDADSLWPNEDFNATRSRSEKSPSRSCVLLSTKIIAPISIGSPSAVPVPCNRMPLIPRSNSASLIALHITFCCATPLGALNELDRPSWLTAELRIVPADIAAVTTCSISSVRYIAMHDSARVYPSAAESKVLQRPSEANMPALSNTIVVYKAWSKFTLATHATLFEKQKRWHIVEAAFKATSEDEQAVSIAIAAPVKPWVNEIRPAATLWAPPVASKDDEDNDDVKWFFLKSTWWSVLEIPT